MKNLASMKNFIELTFINGEKITVHASVIKSVKMSMGGCTIVMADGEGFKAFHVSDSYEKVTEFILQSEQNS